MTGRGQSIRRGGGAPHVSFSPSPPHNRSKWKARPDLVAGLYRKKYRMEDIIQFDVGANIEPTDDGFALVQDGHRVELTHVFADQFAINIFGARRRAAS